MVDITADRAIAERGARGFADPLAEGAIIPAGAMYALDKSGFAIPAAADSPGPLRGVALRRADQTAGDALVEGKHGCIHFESDGSITRADIGKKNAKVVDCHTVGAAGSCTVGIIFDIDDAGVWVKVGHKL